MLTDKSKEDRLRRWTLKRLLGDFCGQSLICEFILALVSLWLLINWSNKTSKEKRPIDFFYYYIQRYFDYFIIIIQDILIILLLFCFFWFNWGYSVNDRLDFILTAIKWDYNANDRLKFILSFIRREDSLNDRLKLVKNGRKENQKWTKWRWKLKKQKMNWKSQIRKLSRWRTNNRWRTVKNDRKPSRIRSRKRLGSVTKAPRLGFSSRKQFFSPKTTEMHSQRDYGYLEQPPFTYL